MPACLVGHPDRIADVLIVDAQSYTKSNMLRMLLGDGLATSEGELWRSQRNLLLPVFSRERLPEYGPIITRHIDRMMSSWQDGSVHDIYRDMMRLTLDVAAESFLGVQLNGRQDALLENLGIVLDEFIVQGNQCFLVPAWVPTRSNRAIHRAVERVRIIVNDIIRERRAEIWTGSRAGRTCSLFSWKRSAQAFPSATSWCRTRPRPSFWEAMRPLLSGWRGCGIYSPSIRRWSNAWRSTWIPSCKGGRCVSRISRA